MLLHFRYCHTFNMRYFKTSPQALFSLVTFYQWNILCNTISLLWLKYDFWVHFLQVHPKISISVIIQPPSMPVESRGKFRGPLNISGGFTARQYHGILMKKWWDQKPTVKKDQIQLVGRNPSLWKPRDPKLIWKWVIIGSCILLRRGTKSLL